jgi:1-pyrroline-5-carboxylate dehydrogenase
MEKILKQAPVNQTLFTGSSNIAEHLVKQLKGKVRIEDAGFDWKILGPDVPK